MACMIVVASFLRRQFTLRARRERQNESRSVEGQKEREAMHERTDNKLKAHSCTTPFRRTFSRIALLLTVLFCAAVWAMPQNSLFQKMTFEVGGGVTPTLGQTSIDLTTGWNAMGGIGYRFDRPLELRLEFMYDGLGVSQTALRRVDEPAGNAHIWSLTLDPVLHLGSVGPFRPYVIFGGGYYQRTVQFTQPTTAVVDIFDPWWGYFGPTLVPANQVLGTVTKGAGGANAGLGLSVKLGQGNTRLFVEARYHYIWTERRATEILPVTFGLRW
jgi:hypothetical protein